ncbi:MAG: histidine kinase [Saprospiraceae bacterium]|nr:histidine kinase [Saprospiraceae bacterium]
MIRPIQYIIRHYWVEIVMVPPFVVGLCYLLYGDAYFESWRNFGSMTFPWLFSSVLSPIGCHWVRNTSLHRFSKLEEWPKRVVWSITGYMIVTVGCAKATYFGLILTRYENLVPSQKNFYGLLLLSAMCVLIISTLYEGVTYFEKWKLAQIETDKLEKLSLETQFQSLQSQLNPHFLFNSLNVLSSLISENPRRAEDFVDELSNVYRYLLRSNERELATVGDELRFVRSYFHLLKTRHDQGILLNINTPETDFQRKIPALSLQILVENAVKHNEISPEKPLLIEIFSQPGARRKEGELLVHRLVVRNQLQRKTKRPTSNRVGLDNLRQRYQLLGVPGFEVRETNGQFEVILPLLDP